MNKEKILNILKENSRLTYGLINLYENCDNQEIRDYVLELLDLNSCQCYKKDKKREEFISKMSDLLKEKENEND